MYIIDYVYMVKNIRISDTQLCNWVVDCIASSWLWNWINVSVQNICMSLWARKHVLIRIIIMLGILYCGYFSLPTFIKDKDEYNINIYHLLKSNTMAVDSLDSRIINYTIRPINTKQSHLLITNRIWKC